MFALTSIEDARSQLRQTVLERLMDTPVPRAGQVRVPLALAWVRGDRGGEGQEMAEVMAASFGYWNRQSAQFFDTVFFGWMTERPSEAAPHHGMYFDVKSFSAAQAQVEELTKWRYSGETDFLLLDWEHDFDSGQGDFVFDRTLPLQVEELVRQGKFGSLDAFVQELVIRAKDVWPPGSASPTYDIANRMALSAGRRSLWEWVSNTLLHDAGKIYDEMRPFVICDLRLKSPPRDGASMSTR